MIAMPAIPLAPLGPDYEAKTASLFLFDERFAKETASYLKPEHFSNVLDRNLFVMVKGYIKAYGQVPSPDTLILIIKGEIKIPEVERPLYVRRIVEHAKADRSDRNFIRDHVNTFCKNQSLLLLAGEIPDLVAKGKQEFIERRMREINAIGMESKSAYYDYWASAEQRRLFRDEQAHGRVILGVTTGFPDIDMHLYRKGYVRGGLTAMMAPSKRGKTALMGQSALYSSLAGMNILYISLEVSEDILSDRLDAGATTTSVTELITKRDDIAKQVAALSGAAGRGALYIETRPSATMSANDVELMVEDYFSRGIKLDGVFLDYIGIMRMDDPKDRYMSLGNAAKRLRGIAGRFNVAMVTGAQTNRDAINKEVSGMDSIGESFAIVQDCDLLLSINANQAEMNSGVRRIFFAASRNEAERTITVQGDLDKMQIIQKVISVTS